MPAAPGTRIGHYEILAPIGAGGMGEVYRASDTKLKRDVAVKVLPEAFARDPERMARFQREAEVLASLNHPNIAAIYGVEERALVMELVEGESPKGPMPFDDAWKIASQIATALEYAHDKGIVHRDLKPANVKVTPDGVVKLLDFGLAKAFTGQRDASTSTVNPEVSPTLTIHPTEAGMILGTAAYMAPEQARGKSVDKRADIWAFGVVLYELLTGERLFQGEDAAETLAAVIHKQPDLSKVAPQARGLIEACLEKDPKKRLRDIGDAHIAIEKGATATAAPAVAPGQSSWVFRSVAALAAVFAIATATLGYIAYRHTREAPPVVSKLSLLPPEEGEFGREAGAGTPALSPDGRHIVFRARVKGTSALWLRDLDSPTPRLLPGTERGSYPFWSPDSRFVGFGDGNKVKRVAVSGGPVLTICDADNLRGATWNQDDVIVFAPSLSTTLFRVPAAGGAPAPLTTLDASHQENSHRFPWFLPDGRHFLFLARSTDEEKSGLYAGDLQSKDRTLILTGNTNAIYVEPGYLLFLREHTLVAQRFSPTQLVLSGEAIPIAEGVDFIRLNNNGLFTASQNGVLAYASGGTGSDLQLTWFDRTGKMLTTVGKPADIERAVLSPDGNTVATDRLDPQSGNRNIWLQDLTRGTEERLTFSGNNRYPVWSPDGIHIAFDSVRAGIGKIYVKSANGTGPEQPLDAGGQFPMDWSRDGRYFLSNPGQRNPKTTDDIWVLPLSGGKAFPLLRTEFREYGARLSPDGRWLAYQSDESKRSEVYVMTFPKPGGKWQISTSGGASPIWSRDGRELYFFSGDNKLMAVEIKSGANFEAGVPRSLFEVRPGAGFAVSPFDVSKDGRFLIPMPPEQSGSDPMTIVLNWHEGLRQ